MTSKEIKYYPPTLDPNMRWFPRPTEKCSEKYYTEKVKLLVNWFKFTSKIYDREYYEYEVKMYKTKVVKLRNGKVETKRSDIAIPDRPKHFWELLRNEKQRNDFNIEEYVFDGKDVVYSVNLHPQPIRTSFRADKNNIEYFLELSFRRPFRLSFSRENPELEEDADRSYRFLKLVMSQKVRYSPASNDKIALEFVKNFVYDSNSILRVPESFYDPDRFDYSLEVAPRIEAWFGIYIGIKELFDGEPVLNFGIVDKLFYNAPKLTLLDYLLLLVDPETYQDERRNERKRQLKRENLTISPPIKSRIDKLLGSVKLKCTEVWDEEKSRLVERHLTYGELSTRNSEEHFVRVMRGRGRDAQSQQVPLFQIYEKNKKYIEYPKLPLISAKCGNTNYLVPMEFLELHEKPQRYKNRIDMAMQDKFLQRTLRKPHQYKEKTIEALEQLDFSSNYLDFVGKFGLCTELKMISCPGKVLNEPNLVNSENKKIKMTPVIRGFQEKKLNVVPEKELCCALFVLKSDEATTSRLKEDDITLFYEELINGCEFRGLPIGKNENKRLRSLLQCEVNGEKKYGFYNNVNLMNGDVNFRAAAEDAKYMFDSLPDNNSKQLIFIVIAEAYLNSYGYIKYYCDNVIGVANQFVTLHTVTKVLTMLNEKKGSRRILYQIALKINAKLNGVNQELNWSENGEMSPEEKEARKSEPLRMYVGIDVTHPTQGSEIDFSIASIVASINPGGTRYRNRIVAQYECRPGERPVAHGRERTDILEGKFDSLLQCFAESNKNQMPSHIVVYRDGVGDSEMLRVSHDELKSLKNEVQNFLKSRGKNEEHPKYTFIVVQKRHKTRFHKVIETECPNEKENAAGAAQWKEEMKTSDGTGIVNPTSGTTVDKIVVSKYKFDFYLSSHHGDLGTSRPGHYHVMYDDNGMTKDEIYKMTYELAFLSARCRKPISLPTPVHYAHLSCEKAKEVYRYYKKGCGDHYPKMTRDFIEQFLQTNVKYPGMSFA